MRHKMYLVKIMNEILWLYKTFLVTCQFLGKYMFFPQRIIFIKDCISEKKSFIYFKQIYTKGNKKIETCIFVLRKTISPYKCLSENGQTLFDNLTIFYFDREIENCRFERKTLLSLQLDFSTMLKHLTFGALHMWIFKSFLNLHLFFEECDLTVAHVIAVVIFHVRFTNNNVQSANLSCPKYRHSLHVIVVNAP